MLKAGVNRAPELIHSLTTTIDQMTWKQNLVIPQRCVISGYKSKCRKMFGLSSSHWIPQPLCQVWLHLHYLYHDRPVVLELWPSDVSIQNITKRFSASRRTQNTLWTAQEERYTRRPRCDIDADEEEGNSVHTRHVSVYREPFLLQNVFII